MTFHFFNQARLTDAIFDRLVAHVVTPEMSEEEKALALMEATSRTQWATKAIYAPKTPRTLELSEPWVPPGTAYLMDAGRQLGTPIGGCGSFTMVLAKGLDRAGIEFRILQMICNGDKPGCHIMLEANLDGRWVALDPLFDQHYRRPDGQLASYADIQSNWTYYRKQVPVKRTTADPSSESYYDVSLFDYKSVRYTNWNKIPVVMPTVKWLLQAVIGNERAEKISIRTYVYDTNRVYAFAGLLMFLLLTGLATVRILLLRRDAQG